MSVAGRIGSNRTTYLGSNPDPGYALGDVLDPLPGDPQVPMYAFEGSLSIQDKYMIAGLVKDIGDVSSSYADVTGYEHIQLDSPMFNWFARQAVQMYYQKSSAFRTPGQLQQAYSDWKSKQGYGGFFTSAYVGPSFLYAGSTTDPLNVSETPGFLKSFLDSIGKK